MVIKAALCSGALGSHTLLARASGTGVSTTCDSIGSADLAGTLPARAPGELDVHHIDTGRGNCTLVVAPDGTTLMIDAGAALGSLETTGSARPDATRRPGEWIARYAARHAQTEHLDSLLVTHLHPDHVGDVNATLPRSERGDYQPTGVSEVDRLLPITTVLDRGFPDYRGAPPAPNAAAKNYVAYLKQRVARGRAVRSVTAGAQLSLSKDPHAMQAPRVRILSANAEVWGGAGVGSPNVAHLPPGGLLPSGEPPNENILSVALRLTHGRFSYYTGGDLVCDTRDGALPWMDIETPVARVAGLTEVATANHHGYFDACGPEFVRALSPQAFILQAWDVGHPGPAQLQRMLGDWSPGSAIRDVFATDMLPVAQLVDRRFTPRMKSRRGHVVVRVAQDTATYRIFVLDSTDEQDRFTASFGPYVCRNACA